MMKLSTKLIASLSVLIALLLVLGMFSLSRLAKINKETDQLATNWLPTIKVIGELNDAINQFRRTELLHIITTNEAEMQQLEQDLSRLRDLVNTKMKQYEPLISEPEEREVYPQFKAQWDEYLTLHKQIEALSQKNQTAEAGRLATGQSSRTFKAASAFLAKLVAVNDKGGHAGALDALNAYDSGKVFILVAMVISVVIGGILSWSLTHNIMRQLGEDPGYLLSLGTEVAGGNLDVTFRPYTGSGGVYAILIKVVKTLKEKIAEAENKTQEAAAEAKLAREAQAAAGEATKKAELAKVEGMLDAAKQLESIVEIVTSASEELSAQIEQSSHGSEEQARRIGETATSMEEMNATVLEVAKNASNAAQAADQARSKAEQGATVVSKVIEEIKQVHGQSQEMETDMGSLGKQAEGIGQILNVISDIADQTNLLALNAAIEAARAGEAGRGFAVVADEVRKLAEKTMTATKEVGEAIRGIQEGTKKNIGNVARVGKTIEEATGLAGQSGDALRQIVGLVEATTDQVRSIATASEEQSSASEEINRSIEDVNRVAMETSEAMRQSASAVEELARQSQILKTLIADMKSGNETQRSLPGSSTKALPAPSRRKLS